MFLLVIFIGFVVGFHELVEGQVEDEKYCPFFYNRPTAPMQFPPAGQSPLNCSWYHEEACCRSEEIPGIMRTLLPLPNSHFNCQIALSRMACWFCSPNQKYFYIGEQVRICQSLCDYIYAVCGEAIIHGKYVSNVYHNGTAFCEERRMMVVDDGVDGHGGCYGGDFDLVSQGRSRFDPSFESKSKLTGSSIAYITVVITIFVIWAFVMIINCK
eukprot:m.2338 g.2338  ORF g.2338 m.2338 type:complete len:213 (-) comp1756_c0_seq2:51-689(-)